jgi:hypothetical protein
MRQHDDSVGAIRGVPKRKEIDSCRDDYAMSAVLTYVGWERNSFKASSLRALGRRIVLSLAIVRASNRDSAVKTFKPSDPNVTTK